MLEILAGDGMGHQVGPRCLDRLLLFPSTAAVGEMEIAGN